MQRSTESGIINTESEIVQNESQTGTECLGLRNRGKWFGGKNTEGQIRGLESRTGQNQEWREGRSRPADGEAARLLDEGRGREVTVAQLGILNGSKNQRVRVIENEADFTPSMKKAYADAKKQGLNIKFFVGDNLLIEEANGSISGVRGYVLGNTVLIRADHEVYTADQLARHEAGHDMIAKGQVNLKQVRSRLKETVGEESYDAVSQAYIEAYGRTGLDADSVWEEFICDSLGDMNIFAQDKAQRELFDRLIPDAKKVVSELKTEAKTTEGVTEGKASRATEDLYTASDEFYREVPFGIREDFARSLANKTSGMADGEIKTIYVVGYVFKADGYMHGHIIAKYDKNTKKILEAARSERGSIDQNTEITNLWAKATGNARRGIGSNSGISQRGRRSGSNDRLLGEESGRNISRDNERVWTNPRTEEENHEIVNKVRIMYGLEPVDYSKQGKFSRELDTEYLSAVERGDMKTAQRMVNEAAKKAGYTVRGLHATNAEFNSFDISKTSSENFHGQGIYFTNSVKDLENNYENYEGPDPWQKIEGRAYELVYDKYGISYEDTLTSDSEIIGKLNECYDIAIEEFKKSGRRITAYLRFDNPLILEKGMQIPDDYAGYDGIIDKQVYENIGHSGMDENTIHYVVLNPNNIKSADPVTYDDNGRVIPLSERFNPEKKDIRYSRELDLIDYINEKAKVERANMTKAQLVAKVRAELEGMNVGTAEIMAVQKMADRLYERYGGDASISEFRQALFEATRLALSKDGYDASFDIIDRVAREVAYNPKNIGSEAELLSQVKKYCL